MIIDFHGHADEYETFGWIDPPERVVDLMDRAGIDLTCITTYGEAPGYPKALSNLLDFVGRFPERLTGFLRVNPSGGDAALSAMEEAAKHPEITGFKLHPISNLLKPYNPFCVAVMKKAAELGLPVFIHCGDKVAAQPWQIGLGAGLCPETQIICHMGGFFHGEESIRMAKACPNVCLDTSSTPYPAIVRRAVEELGADRVLFATDNPAGDPVSDLRKMLDLHFDPETEAKILYKNAVRLLGLKTIRGHAV
ncbi:amidohydrolase family protein [Anaerotruncus rubiinfantis]|uniref:amidohydrolase family protein n=1 Tax=Anaerotruncus rubiinfantis TaxID=1720200 RepID=UPI001896E093|nr:amidohydrolase family protein [Anaerotruncus rubiinfantis]